MRMRKRMLFVALLTLGVLTPNPGFAENKPAPKAASMGGGDLQKPLEVKGQTRNISMMLVNQNNKNKVKFVSGRNNFREEVLLTNY